MSYAAQEFPEDRGALDWKLRELRGAADLLERLALGFRRADERAEALTAGTAAR